MFNRLPPFQYPPLLSSPEYSSLQPFSPEIIASELLIGRAPTRRAPQPSRPRTEPFRLRFWLSEGKTNANYRHVCDVDIYLNFSADSTFHSVVSFLSCEFPFLCSTIPSVVFFFDWSSFPWIPASGFPRASADFQVPPLLIRPPVRPFRLGQITPRAKSDRPLLFSPD